MAIGYACGDRPHVESPGVNSSVVARDKVITVPYTAEQRVSRSHDGRASLPRSHPRREPHTAARRQNQLRGPPRASTNVRLLMPAGSTVLVIESDESTQRLLQQTLRSRYTVLMASCWSQAREIRGRAAVDAMVVNVNLTSGEQPGLDALCAEAGKTPCRAGGR